MRDTEYNTRVELATALLTSLRKTVETTSVDNLSTKFEEGLVTALTFWRHGALQPTSWVPRNKPSSQPSSQSQNQPESPPIDPVVEDPEASPYITAADIREELGADVCKTGSFRAFTNQKWLVRVPGPGAPMFERASYLRNKSFMESYLLKQRQRKSRAAINRGEVVRAHTDMVGE